MKAWHFIPAFGLAVWLAQGCATTTHRSGLSPAPPFTRGIPASYAHFAAGESCFDNDDPAGTLKHWEAAALADPSNEKLVVEVGGQLLQEKEFARALALLAKSANRADASAEVLAWLGRAQIATNRLSDALATSKRAIRRDPASLDGYECQLEVLLLEKQWHTAARTLHRAALHLPSDPAVLLALGDLYNAYLKDQPKDARTETQEVALLDRIDHLPIKTPRLKQQLADDYGRVKREKKAAEIYLRLLADFPEPSLMRDSIHQKLVELYVQSDDRTNATKQLQAIVRDNPTHYPRAWFVLGELACQGTNLADAEEDFANALRWEPTLEQAYYDLAMVQLDLHKSREAFDTMNQARLRFANTFAFEFYTGIVYAQVKDFPMAIQHFKEAEIIGLSTDPSRLDERFYFRFGAVCERNHDFKQAEEYLQKSVKLDPEFAEAMNYLGYMLADLGQQLPRARTLIDKAVALDPKNGAYLDSLGWVLFKLNQPHQALPQLLKALQFTPEPDATVLDHLGEVYQALHQTAKAVEAWKKSLSIESNEEVKHKLERFSGGAF